MKPTTSQIKTELAALESLKDRIPQHSVFGDDNRAKIEAQIDVIKSGMSEKEVYKKYEPDETAEEYQDSDMGILDDALYARQWLDGQATDGSPSENWISLVK